MTILLKSDILELFKISETTLHRWINDSRNGTGTFPLPISPPHKTLRWNSDDVERWCQSKQITAAPAKHHKVDVIVTKHEQCRLKNAAERHGLTLK